MKNNLKVLFMALTLIGTMSLSVQAQVKTTKQTTSETKTVQKKMDNTATAQNATVKKTACEEKMGQKKAVKNRASMAYRNRATTKYAPYSATQMQINRNALLMTKSDVDMLVPTLETWPASSRSAAEVITEKYGKPDVSGPEVLGWINKGSWKMIHVTRMEIRHDFPFAHNDVLMQTINYTVPIDKVADLAQFDGSIIVDRTQGLLSARSDKEEHNFLALNLVNDIVTGMKTVAQARQAYGDIIKEKRDGGNPAYMQGLTFSQNGNGDADINTTGLSKDDMMKGGNVVKPMHESEKMDEGK